MHTSETVCIGYDLVVPSLSTDLSFQNSRAAEASCSRSVMLEYHLGVIYIPFNTSGFEQSIQVWTTVRTNVQSSGSEGLDTLDPTA